MRILITLFTIVFLFTSCSRARFKDGIPPLPEGFVYLQSANSTIYEEIRYATSHNFIGKPIDGYAAARCILSKEAASALAKVQEELKISKLSLKIYDCYRPQQAVNRFVSWARDLEDKKMKKEFYPNVEKTALFKDGYIAAKSGHSRGSTVDLTLVALPLLPQERYEAGDELHDCTLSKTQRFMDNSLDFGTGYDCFDPLAHTENPNITPTQKENRKKLKTVMEKYGFKGMATEWWHFTLQNEPYPQTYFDFPVE